MTQLFCFPSLGLSIPLSLGLYDHQAVCLVLRTCGAPPPLPAISLPLPHCSVSPPLLTAAFPYSPKPLPSVSPSSSPWQPAPWGAAWYPAGHTHRKLPGVFSHRPRSHGGGTRWHSSTSAGTNPEGETGADTPPHSPPRPPSADSGRMGGGEAGVEPNSGPGQTGAGARGSRRAQSG